MITLEDFEGDALEVVIEGFTIGNESTKYAISYNNAYYTTIENPGQFQIDYSVGVRWTQIFTWNEFYLKYVFEATYLK